MTAEQAPHAFAALQQAMALAPDHADEKEQAFIDALSVRYVKDFDPDNPDGENNRTYFPMKKYLAGMIPFGWTTRVPKRSR